MQVQQSPFTSPHGSLNSAEPVQSALHSQSLFHSTLASAKTTSCKTSICGFFKTVGSYVQKAWDFVYRSAKRVLGLIFCRCWTKPEPELNIDKAWLDYQSFVKYNNFTAKKENAKTFEMYPTQFKKEFYAIFTSVSKEKIDTPEKIFQHPHCKILLRQFFSFLIFKKQVLILDRILEKIGNRTNNLMLFTQMPKGIKCDVIFGLFSNKVDVCKKIKEVSKAPQKYLTKERFKPVIENLRDRRNISVARQTELL